MPIDVFYEGRALAAHEGGGRLGWSRVRCTGKRGGVFHPKVVLALLQDTDGLESLVVSVASANLTRTGWWTNVECADVVRLEDGERHGYLDGLVTLVDQLAALTTADRRPATTRIRDFLARQQPYTTKTEGGRMRPSLLPGYEELPQKLVQLGGSRLRGAHLEVISPFLDEDPGDVTSALHALRVALQPRTVTVALPVREGATTVTREVFDSVAASGVTWGRVPRPFTRTTGGVEAGDRAIHAKVYHLWRGGSDSLDVWVTGSHNLTDAAHSGRRNFEVSVVHETNARGRALLESLAAEPLTFGEVDPDLEEKVDLVDLVPVTVRWSWKTLSGSVTWDPSTQPPPVTLSLAGSEVLRTEWPAGVKTIGLDARSGDALHQALLTTSLLLARTDDGREGPVLVVEDDHDCKPDLLVGVHLTPAEILALWAVPDLRERLKRLARIRTSAASDEDDLELARVRAIAPLSMFDQLAGVFQAFGGLSRRVQDALAEKAPGRAARLLWAPSFDSPINVLKLALDADDPVLAYVTYRCAAALDDEVVSGHAGLAGSYAELRRRFLEQLGHVDTVRERIVQGSSDPAATREFLDWFDKHFAEEISA